MSVTYVLIIGLSVINIGSPESILKNQTEEEGFNVKDVAMNFFSEFNNLFGNDWWGSEPETDGVHEELGHGKIPLINGLDVVDHELLDVLDRNIEQELKEEKNNQESIYQNQPGVNIYPSSRTGKMEWSADAGIHGESVHNYGEVPNLVHDHHYSPPLGPHPYPWQQQQYVEHNPYRSYPYVATHYHHQGVHPPKHPFYHSRSSKISNKASGQMYPAYEPAASRVPPPFFYRPPNRDAFLDGTLDSFMFQAPTAPIQQTGDTVSPLDKDLPIARSYGDDDERDYLGAQELNEDAKVVNNKDSRSKQSDQFFPTNFMPSVPVEPSNYFLHRNLDDFMSQPSYGPPIIPKLPLHLIKLNYILLSPFLELVRNATIEYSKDVVEDFPEEDDTTVCITPDGYLGTCMSSSLCSTVSGHSSGTCSIPSVLGVHTCCIHTAKCGKLASEFITYIHNPDYPVPSAEVFCPISIALEANTCQVRIDFLHLTLSPPEDGICDEFNTLSISTSPGGTIAQDSFCGPVSNGSSDPLSTNTPHMYAHYDMDADPGPFTTHHINFLFTVTNHPSSWNIRVAQVPCQDTLKPSTLLASLECSQWYASSVGNITSFGSLQVENKFKACIKPDPLACFVTYRVNQVSCSSKDQVQIMGLDKFVCDMSQGYEVVLPIGKEMGIIIQKGGYVSYNIGFELEEDCNDADD